MSRCPAKSTRKIILKNGYSPGDIVMMTAAVRDLHLCYPGRFLTDVRTRCQDLWQNNPYITSFGDSDETVEHLECEYPLINRANEAPYHCLHGYIEFLNDSLGISIKPTAYKGDIHLSNLEKSWASQIYELTGRDIPFWIVGAGGKHDITIKWWDHSRYQQIIDYFGGRIQFVQVGAYGDHHPALKGAIDLRGQTTLRELVRLVYHAQGVLCSITALMHLAAAVEVKGKSAPVRPCVVVAGAREPAHWEAYPAHQFVHRNGALPCSTGGGCWKDRVVPLGDGDERDKPEHLCTSVVEGMARCMHLISADEIIRRIETYFDGGSLSYLKRAEAAASRRAVRATASNPFDTAPLTLGAARHACERFIANIESYPKVHAGRGVVICAGGDTYFSNAWVCIQMLRRWGCKLPIEVWYLNRNEFDRRMAALLAPLGVTCVNASWVQRKHPVRMLGGWQLKPYAILHSRFREVLLLDADNMPVVDPTFLFDAPEYRATGAVFWPDFGKDPKADIIWHSCNVTRPSEPEFETGQIVVNKERCWKALRLTMWFNEHSDFYYTYLYGDKETFHLAFAKTGTRFSLVPTPIHSLPGTMCQHDFSGRRIFQHRNTAKWVLSGRNVRVKDFWFEDDCLAAVAELRKRWKGRVHISTNL